MQVCISIRTHVLMPICVFDTRMMPGSSGQLVGPLTGVMVAQDDDPDEHRRPRYANRASYATQGSRCNQ
jgi:hypothetical protein